MDNLKSNALVSGAVTWAVDGEAYWAVNRTVSDAVYGAVYWAVYWAVDDAVNRDVDRAVLRVRRDDPDHPGLQDFLRSCGEVGEI